MNIVKSIKAHADFNKKYKDNSDPHTKDIAFEKILQDVMLKRRRDELDLYKLFASDPSFKTAMTESAKTMVLSI